MTKGKYHVIILAFVTFIALGKERNGDGKLELIEK